MTVAEWAADYHSRQPRAPDLPPTELLRFEIKRLYSDEGRSLQEVCGELRLSPGSVCAVRCQMGVINENDFRHEVQNLLTHRIWELCKQDEDGIIPYDDGLPNPPLLTQVRKEIEEVFGADRVVGIEAEMDEILGRGGLEGWLGDPFFRKHVRQFKKRPILWQIVSPRKRFRILVYYHKLDHDTLPKIRGQYLWPLLEQARFRLRAAQRTEPLDLKAVSELEEEIADLQQCDARLEQVIQGTVKVKLPDWAVGPYREGRPPYDPDLNDGVRVNLLPLQAAGLLPVKKVV